MTCDDALTAEGLYADGLSPGTRSAQLRLDGRRLLISVGGGPVFGWDYGSIRLDAEPTPAGPRFFRVESGARTGESLVIPAGLFADALGARCGALRAGVTNRRAGMALLAGLAAVLLLTGALIFYGIPALASRLAAWVPWSTEDTLGSAVEAQVLREVGGRARLCAAGRETAGTAALASMVERLSAQTKLPGPLQVKVLDSPVRNAFALPGGRIVFMRGLIENAESAEEVAGVLAHEMGHVANRDSMRGLINAGGISFLLGLMVGDVAGAGALLVASRHLLTSRHSRASEAEADAFAVDVLTKAGVDARALARFLERVAAAPGERRMELLLTHPVTADRVAEILRRAGSAPATPVLSAAQWQALRSICRD